jgi:hypothetical protein
MTFNLSPLQYRLCYAGLLEFAVNLGGSQRAGMYLQRIAEGARLAGQGALAPGKSVIGQLPMTAQGDAPLIDLLLATGDGALRQVHSMSATQLAKFLERSLEKANLV